MGLVSQTLTGTEIVPVKVEDHVKPSDLLTPWHRGTHWLVWCRRGARTSLGQSPTNLSDGESITSEQRRVLDLTWNQPLCAKRFWKGDVSNDRYAVAADVLQKSTILDVTGEQRMNMKLKGTGVCLLGRGLHSWIDREEYKMKVSRNFCYQADWLVRNVAGAARWGVGECVSVSVHSVTLGRATPWRSVISDLWQSPWITGAAQTLYKTSLFDSETLKIRSVWKKGGKRWQLLPMFHLAKLFISAVKLCWSISRVSLGGLEW